MTNPMGKHFKISDRALPATFYALLRTIGSRNAVFVLGLALVFALSATFSKSGHTQQVPQVVISGVINDNRGQPMPDIVIAVDGTRRVSTVTSTDGSYSLMVPADGSYVVTPFSSGAIFNPGSLRFDHLSANVGNVNFIGTRVRTFKVSGRIIDEHGAGVGDVVIRVSDSPQMLTISGPTGLFSFDHLSGGTGYTLTPSKAGVTFEPPGFAIPSLTRDFSGINFVVVPQDKVRISGIVTDSAGEPLPDVIVGLNGPPPALVPTSSAGVFSFTVPVGGNYLIAPARDGYTFNPPSLSLSNVKQSISSVNFVGTPAPVLEISGVVVDGNGMPLVDVPVTITGSTNGTSPTGPIGNYGFSVLASGNYTVIPALPGVVFSPPSRSFTNLTSPQTGVNFVGVPGNSSGATPTPSPGALLNLPGETPSPEASPSPSPSPSPEEGASPIPTPKDRLAKPAQKPGEEKTPPQTPQAPNTQPGPADKAAVTNAKTVSGKGARGRRGRNRRVARGKRTTKRTGAVTSKKRPPKKAKKKG